MDNLIFGYTFDEIKQAQQKKGPLGKPIQGQPVKPAPTESDLLLLEKYGLDGLITMGFHGVIDRLKTGNVLAPKPSR